MRRPNGSKEGNMRRAARYIFSLIVLILGGFTILLLTGRPKSPTPVAEELLHGGQPQAGVHANAPAETISTPLVHAAGNGDLKAVKALIAEGADVNEAVKSMHSWTPLHSAIIMGGNEDVVFFLLEKHANPNVGDSQGMTPLMYAVNYGDAYTNVVRALITAGADVNARDRFGNDALDSLPPEGGNKARVVFRMLKAAGAKERGK